MDDDNHRNYIVNMKLMKMIGFYQLINPDTSKYFGYNPYKVVAAIEIVYAMLSTSMLILSSYYYLHNTNELMNHFMLVVALFFTMFKLFCVSRNSELIWNCMAMTSTDFLSYKDHQKDALRSARSKSISMSVLFLVLWGSVTVAWCLSPFFVKGVYLDIEINDEARRYRYNVLNYVYPISDQFYNDNFLAFYSIEMLQVVFWGHATISYDTFVISMCIAIGSQLKIIATSYSALCYHLKGDHVTGSEKLSTTGGKCSTKHIDINELEGVLNLKLLIRDQQHMLKKIREILEIFEPVTFVQLAAQSMLIIFQSYMIFINYYNGLPLVSVPIIKLFLTVTPNIIHLFITCYLFGHINYEKESMNFALYCSDWTKMNIKYKKLLLLTMQMNNAEKLKLKISLNRIVNLEMFANVMHTTYSIISVLAKSYGNTT